MDYIFNTFQGPALFIGDFNSIMSQEEKRGGNPYAESSSGGFRGAIEDMGLIDLGFSGNAFIWSNKRRGRANIKERLDRGITSAEWRDLFPKAVVKHLPGLNSGSLPVPHSSLMQELLSHKFKQKKLV